MTCMYLYATFVYILLCRYNVYLCACVFKYLPCVCIEFMFYDTIDACTSDIYGYICEGIRNYLSIYLSLLYVCIYLYSSLAQGELQFCTCLFKLWPAMKCEKLVTVRHFTESERERENEDLFTI